MPSASVSADFGRARRDLDFGSVIGITGNAPYSSGSDGSCPLGSGPAVQRTFYHLRCDNKGVRVITFDIIRCDVATNDRIRVKSVMSTSLRTISPEATVKEAAKAMRESDTGVLIVRSSSTAIVTSSDVLDAVVTGSDLTAVRVADVMTTPVEAVTPDLQMEEVAAMMTNFGIEHLPVVEDDYVGTISLSDVTARLQR